MTQDFLDGREGDSGHDQPRRGGVSEGMPRRILDPGFAQGWFKDSTEEGPAVHGAQGGFEAGKDPRRVEERLPRTKDGQGFLREGHMAGSAPFGQGNGERAGFKRDVLPP